MQYRLAKREDIDVLIQLRKQQLLDEGLPSIASITPIDDALRAYFSANLGESIIVWVAADGDAVVATGGVCFYRLPPTYSNPTGGVAYVTNMYTSPAYRRRGIATELLGRVVREALLRGYTVLRLHASEQGRALYARFGFEESQGYMALKR